MQWKELEEEEEWVCPQEEGAEVLWEEEERREQVPLLLPVSLQPFPPHQLGVVEVGGSALLLVVEVVPHSLILCVTQLSDLWWV